MNVLEKIFKEIEDHAIEFESFGVCDDYVGVGWVKEIIRSYMDDSKTFEFDFNKVKSFDCQCGRHYVNTYNDGWIPVEDGLPEVNKIVKVTVHSSEWISDFDSSWVPEEEKRRHPEAYKVYDGYIDESGKWVFIDEEFSENICEGSFGEDKGRIYDVVIAWQLLPEPYRPEDIQEASSCFCNN